MLPLVELLLFMEFTCLEHLTKNLLEQTHESTMNTKDRNTSLLTKTLECQLHEQDIVIPVVLLNARSLKKHSLDIKFDKNIFNCPLILLTETQLLPSESHNDIQENLSPLLLQRQDSNDRFSSLALCHKSTVIITEKEYFPLFNGVKFCATFCEHQSFEIGFLLLYRKHYSNLDDFVDNLTDILNQYSVEVVLGDFNCSYFREKNLAI